MMIDIGLSELLMMLRTRREQQEDEDLRKFAGRKCGFAGTYAPMVSFMSLMMPSVMINRMVSAAGLTVSSAQQGPGNEKQKTYSAAAWRCKAAMRWSRTCE
jgi:hypothetical protein